MASLFLKSVAEIGLTVSSEKGEQMLTDAALKHLRPKEKPYKVTDRDASWKPKHSVSLVRSGSPLLPWLTVHALCGVQSSSANCCRHGGSVYFPRLRRTTCGSIVPQSSNEVHPQPQFTSAISSSRSMPLQSYMARRSSIRLTRSALPSIAHFVPRDRSLSPTEIRIMLKQLDHVATLPTIRPGIRLYLLTMVRKSELTFCCCCSVSFMRSFQKRTSASYSA